MIGSIYVPSTVRHKMETSEGEVVAVGSGSEEIPMEVSVGDTVIFMDGDHRLRIDDNVLLDLDDVLFVKA